MQGSTGSAAGRRPRLRAVLPRRPRERSSATQVADPGYGSGRWQGARPYATIALVLAGVGVYIGWHAWPPLELKLIVFGPLHGDWWRLFSYAFTYGNGVYAFATLVAVAVFGWLLEQRHGPAVVIALFLGASVAGALVALAVYKAPIVSGGNAGALALLGAWAAPDLRAARAGHYYEGDLIATGVAAGLLLLMPFAIEAAGVEDFHLIGSAASWLAGVCGGVIGLVAGVGLGRPMMRRA
jgi:membrane associated rhomboid family serine protease